MKKSLGISSVVVIIFVIIAASVLALFYLIGKGAVRQAPTSSQVTSGETYTNQAFGFSLTIPASWESAEVAEQSRAFGRDLVNPSVVFTLKGLPTQDADFISLRGQEALANGADISLWIHAHPKDQWAQLKDKMDRGTPLGLTFLGENDSYVFSSEVSMRPNCFGAEELQPCRPPSDLQSTWDEAGAIAATFELL